VGRCLRFVLLRSRVFLQRYLAIAFYYDDNDDNDKTDFAFSLCFGCIPGLDRIGLVVSSYSFCSCHSSPYRNYIQAVFLFYFIHLFIYFYYFFYSVFFLNPLGCEICTHQMVTKKEKKNIYLKKENYLRCKMSYYLQ